MNRSFSNRLLFVLIVAIFVVSCSGGAGDGGTSDGHEVALSITTATSANGVVGASYTQTIQATGGAAPFAWTVSSGVLPNNLSLSTSTTSTVTVSGVPDTVAQSVAFAIQVTDSAHHVATQAYTVSILQQADGLILSPASMHFGNELVGSASGALAETLTNSGTADIALTNIGMTGSNVADFNQTTNCSASLPVGASCAIDVIFTPAQIGPRSAALTITDNTAGSPQSVPLSGVGVTEGPNVTPSVSNLPFGVQLVGTTSPALSVTLSNYGSMTSNISNVAATTSFSETDNCVPSLASGATCTISVTFIPGAWGAMTGTLSISDDAPSNPQHVSLSGTGSTNTPVLTGYCVVQISNCLVRQNFSGNCPAGQPAEHPSELTCVIPPHTSGPVDLARHCSIEVSAGPSGGFCGTN